ncbi:MAG TPA: hypothetical protein VK927_11440 [Adhaeribacter sp.]|nr:hypothetical protein [Adhaeribacter sp.]
MQVTNKIRIKLSKLKKKAKRIFKVCYEDISTQIYYDVKNTFWLLILRDEQQVLLNRQISRAEAFHIMNTRH